jgi:membrane associated rhomboid family serine protease
MSSLRPAQYDFSGTFARPPSATLALMVITGVVSVAGMASAGRFGAGLIVNLLHFSPSQVLDGWRVWAPFTYLFLETDPFSLLLYEALGLWMFASPLERRWGSRRFLLFFFSTGTGAALVTSVLGLWSVQLRITPVQGTWIAAESILVGWVLVNWYSTAFLFFFPVRAPYLLVFALGIPLLNLVRGLWEPFIPVLAGMTIAYLMLNHGHLSPRRGLLRLRAWWIRQQFKVRARRFRVVPPPDRHRNDGPGRYLQ